MWTKERWNYWANIFWSDVFDTLLTVKRRSPKCPSILQFQCKWIYSPLRRLVFQKMLSLRTFPVLLLKSLLIFNKDREEMLHISVAQWLDWCSDIAEIFYSKCTGFESHLEYMEWDFAWVALVCSGGFGCDHLLSSHHSLFVIIFHCPLTARKL